MEARVRADTDFDFDGVRETNYDAPYFVGAGCGSNQGGTGAIPGFLREQVQSALTGGPYAAGGTPCDQVGSISDNLIGYITIDTAISCTTSLPIDATYFPTEILWENQLIGDYIRLNDAEGVAGGNPLVHIKALPGGDGVPVTTLPNTFYQRYQQFSPAGDTFDRRQPLPALFAARFWKIPLIIHESDTVPGRANKWGSKFASRIAVSFPQAASFFPQDKVAHTGNPIRREVRSPAQAPERSEFNLGEGTRTIFIIGGSLGSQTVNEVILQTLPELLKDYEVIHQTGRGNLADMNARSKVLLQNHPEKQRYHPFGYLSTSQVAAAGRLCDIVISRAGSTIFEIAAWSKPAILIPIADSNGDHQRENAYAYSESGAADVLEESNLTTTILKNQIQKILGDEKRSKLMSERAAHFAKTDAAETIAREILEIALKHER